MLDLKTILVLIWWLLSITTTILYIRTIIKKQTIPHTYSYLIWTITITEWFLWQLYDNSWIWTIILFIVGLWVFSTFMFSLKYWLKNPSKLDKIFLTLALISIIPRLLTKTPLYSVILVTFIDFLWYLPTINKIKRYPNSEVLYPRIIWTTSLVTWLIALDHYTVLSSLYLFVWTFMNSAVILEIIFFKKFKLWTLTTK